MGPSSSSRPRSHPRPCPSTRPRSRPRRATSAPRGCVFAEDEAALLVEAAATPAELERMVARPGRGQPLELLWGAPSSAGCGSRSRPASSCPGGAPTRWSRRAAALAARRAPWWSTCAAGPARSGAALAAVPGLEVYAADVDPAAVACARRQPAAGPGLRGRPVRRAPGRAARPGRRARRQRAVRAERGDRPDRRIVSALRRILDVHGRPLDAKVGRLPCLGRTAPREPRVFDVRFELGSLRARQSCVRNASPLAGQLEQQLSLACRQLRAFDAFWLDRLAVATRAEHEIAHLKAENGLLTLLLVERPEQRCAQLHLATERLHRPALELVGRGLRRGMARASVPWSPASVMFSARWWPPNWSSHGAVVEGSPTNET